MLCEITLSVALLTVGQGRALPEIPLSRAAVLPPDVYLVKAHALNATSLEIDHVYVGPADLKGKTFLAELFFSKLVGMMILDVKIPVANGQPGIWWIKRNKGELASVFGQIRPWFSEDLPRIEDGLQVMYGIGGPFALPSEEMVFAPAWRGDKSKAGDARYEIAAARAEVFEKIYHAADKDRLKVIDDYVRSHDSVKGAAALMLLLRGNHPIMISKDTKLPPGDRYRVEKFPKIADYVLPFSKDDALSLRVQLEVEKLLILNKDGWKDSPEEWKMIMHWYTGGWKEKENVPWQVSDETLLVDYLLRPPSLYQYARTSTAAETLELAVAGLANGARSDRFKTRLAELLRGGLPPGGPAAAEKGFVFLVQTIGKDATPARRVAAAKLVGALAPFSAEQRATLKGLRQQKLGDEVTKELTKVLEEKGSP